MMDEAATPTGVALSTDDAVARLAALRQPEEEQAGTPPEQVAPEVQEETQQASEQATEAGNGEQAETGSDVQESEQRAFQKLSDIAEQMGVDVSDIYTLKVPVKIDGEESEVTLAEALKSYQYTGHLNRKDTKLAEDRKAFDEQRQGFEQTRVQAVHELQSLAALAQQLVHGEWSKMDAAAWEKLRQEDEIGYLTQKARYQEHMQALTNLDQYLKGTVQQHYKQQYEAKFAEEQQKLLQAFPAWSDAKVFEAEAKKLREGAKQHYGVESQELSQIIDHRFFGILNDAIKWREHESKKPAVINKVREAPKVAKTSAPAPATNKTQEIAARLKQTGSVDDAVALLRARRTKK